MHDIETSKKVAGFAVKSKGPSVDMEKKCGSIKSSLVQKMHTRYSDLEEDFIEATVLANIKSWPRENVAGTVIIYYKHYLFY